VGYKAAEMYTRLNRDVRSKKANQVSAVADGPARRAASRAQWRRGVVVSGVRRMNEVNARRTRLLPGWVTVFGRVYHLCM